MRKKWNYELRRLVRGFLFGSISLGLLILISQSYSRDDKIPSGILTKQNPVAGSATVLESAKDNYEDNCYPCHGAEGHGDGPMAGTLKKRPADLSKSRELAELTDGEIFWRITKGRDPMPRFEEKLTEAERWGLVHIVRSISHTKAHNVPVVRKGP